MKPALCNSLQEDLDSVLFNLVYHEMDIVPIEFSRGKNLEEILNNLPPDVARRMKRKFRKLWRKAAKKPTRYSASKDYSDRYKVQLGLGDKSPSSAKKWRRHGAVHREVLLRFLDLKNKIGGKV